MKNLLLLCLLSLLAFGATAQDDPLTGKKGQPILPEKGDIGLGVNMIPFFNWFGNAFNGTNTSPGNANTFGGDNKFFQIFGNSVIMGKYMLSEKSAVRISFGFNVGSIHQSMYVQDDASNSVLDMVLDSRKQDYGDYTLALGYEMRRGKGRIQGYFGADIIIQVRQASGFAYTYGNQFADANIVPTSHNWGNNIGTGANANKRTLFDGSNTTFGMGLRGFIGVEYFVAPKFSIGCEFGWGFMVNGTFETVKSDEFYEASTQTTMIDDTKTAGSVRFNAGVDNLNGVVFMYFYF
jgi:hypothetical protein